jgi:hypothetical protein
MHRNVLVAVAMMLAGAGAVTDVGAQQAARISGARPARFEAWRASLPGEEAPSRLTYRPARTDRTRRALIGGAIGAAAGFITCTAISTLVDDSADPGLSFCPLDTTLIFLGGGFGVGALAGLLL